MISRIAQYKIKAEKIDDILEAIREFVKDVKGSEPGTIYTAYQMEDKVSFIHFMSFQSNEEEDRHKNAEYTKKFVEKLYPNCIEDPVFTELKEIN